jgi:hypothetical protein
MQPAFPGSPSDRLRISSLTVARQRGILTRFSPHPVDEDARTKEVEKERKATLPPPEGKEEEWIEVYRKLLQCRYCTVTATGLDAMPFATTSRVLPPVSMSAGTSKCVDTGLLPVATAMVL